MSTVKEKLERKAAIVNKQWWYQLILWTRLNIKAEPAPYLPYLPCINYVPKGQCKYSKAPTAWPLNYQTTDDHLLNVWYQTEELTGQGETAE